MNRKDAIEFLKVYYEFIPWPDECTELPFIAGWFREYSYSGKPCYSSATKGTIFMADVTYTENKRSPYQPYEEVTELFRDHPELAPKRAAAGGMNKGDVVNHPSHYQGKVECIDAIESATHGKTGLEAVCTANVIKYLWRYPDKNGIEDVQKAAKYIQFLIKYLEDKEVSK